VTRRFGALLSTLANGDPVDWRLVESAWVGGAIRTSESWITRFGTTLLQSAWNLVLTFAGLQVLVALANYGAIEADSRLLPSWLLLLNVITFAVASLVFLVAGRQDSRSRALGAFFLIVAAAFAHPVLGRAAAAGQIWWVIGFSRLPADAFLAASVWAFVWVFPTTSGDRTVSGVGRIGLGVSGVCGALLFLLSLANGVLTPHSHDSAWRVAFDRDQSSSLYWLLVFACVALAIPYLFWKARRESSADRRKVALVLTAFGVGITPMVLAVLLSVVWPVLGRPPYRDLIGIVLFASLASIAPTAAHAVLVDRVMEWQLSIGKAVQRSLARRAVWGASLLPVIYVVIDLYVHRNVPLAAYVGDEGAFGFFLLVFTGITALTFRYQMLNGVDRWFTRERADCAEALARLERDLRAARTTTDIAGAVAAQVERTLRPDSVSVLVLADDERSYSTLAGPVQVLGTDSTLVELLQNTNDDRVCLEPSGPVRPLLPRSDQEWLQESNTHTLVPMQDSCGRLLGFAALGAARDAVDYSVRDIGIVRSMCGRAALQLESLHRSESSRPAELGHESRAVDWRSQPARVCSRCSLVWPHHAGQCSCGAQLSVASLPLLFQGKFKIERLLGAGGMGVVYLATDMTLGRQVALKTLPTASAALAARLQQEARTMANVRHPNLALIYGAEQWRGSPVLSVEYLEGGTLLDWLRRGPLTVDEALSLGIVVADVLDRLHRSGILHRDVKPSNIGYTLSGEAKLLDLGLAVAFDGEDAVPSDGRTDVRDGGSVLGSEPREWSQTGHLFGTLRYMAPEALAGLAEHPSFDLWSLGFVLYEAIAGNHPFAHHSPSACARSISEGRIPDVRDLAPECPGQVAGFLRDALSVVPDRRPRTAAQFRAALQHLRSALAAP
jgi:hypothetical protein